MLKRKHILSLVTIAIVTIIIIYQSKLQAVEEQVVEPEEEEIVLTRVDSLLISYDTLITNEIQKANPVGAAIVISYKGKISYLKCYGVKELGGSDSIDAHTLFRLASVSKTITGVLAGILADDSIIDLDDKIIDYLPDFELKDSLNTVDLSVRNILSHTSGLVPHAYDGLVEDHRPFSLIMDSLMRVNIHGKPGELYGYQNVVFSLYDTISVIKTGKRFGSLLEDKVFTPFGMTDASTGFDPFLTNNNVAKPHAGRSGNFRKLRLNDRYYITLPAAGINASISDMGQFIAHLTIDDSLKMGFDHLDEVFSPQVKSPLRWNYLRKWDRVDSKHYGLGWRIIGYKGHSIAYHGGYVQGYRAEIAVCREEGIGIAYLTNSPNSLGSEVVPLFLNMYFEP